MKTLVLLVALAATTNAVHSTPVPERSPFVILTSIKERNGSIVVTFTGDPRVHTVEISEKSKPSKEKRESILKAKSFVSQRVKIHVITADQKKENGIVTIHDSQSSLEITLYDPDRPAAWEYFESESGSIMIRGGIPRPPTPGFTMIQPIKMTL